MHVALSDFFCSRDYSTHFSGFLVLSQADPCYWHCTDLSYQHLFFALYTFQAKRIQARRLQNSFQPIKPRGQFKKPLAPSKIRGKEQTKPVPVKTSQKMSPSPSGGKKACPECNKTFSNRSGLHYHMQHHTGNYRFRCDICQKGFTMKKHLKDHIRKHEGKFYVCEFCAKRFQAKYSLDCHLPEHTGKYPFHCATCNQGFLLRAQLEAHENQHEGIGFTCLKCSKTLYSQKDFQKHREKCNKK